MALPSFFRTPKPKRFNFTPRYYDADKEEFEQRVQQSLREAGVKTDEKYVPHIKGQMRGYFKRPQKAQQYSNIRLIIILAVLLAMFYYLFMY